MRGDQRHLGGAHSAPTLSLVAADGAGTGEIAAQASRATVVPLSVTCLRLSGIRRPRRMRDNRGVPVASLLGLLVVATMASFDPGPRIGEPLPPFQAVDQDGRARDFLSLKGPKGLALLVYRSADW